MIFLNILLCILKIIGIAILVILGLIILILCLILFVPIRYKIYASFHQKPHVSAHITYLLKLLHVDFELNGKESELKIKIFGHNISDKKEKNSRENKKSNHSNRREEVNVKQAEQPEKVPDRTDRIDKMPQQVQNLQPKQTIAKADNSSDSDSENKSVSAKKAEKSEKSPKNPAKTENKADRAADKNDRHSEISGKVKAIIVLLKENRPVIDFVLRCLKILFKHILPGSHVINIKLGFDDPALLGELLGAAAVIRAMTGLVINITPVWDETVFEAEADLKGRIILGRVLYIAAVVYFNKEVKKFIKAIKNI